MKRMARSIATVAAAGMIALGTIGPAAANHRHGNEQSGGAAGVVAAVVQVNRVISDIEVLVDIDNIEIVTVKDSLNNVLNRSPILSNNVVTIQNFLNNCTVASCIEIRDFLNDNNIAISDVVAVEVLSGNVTIFVM